MQFLYFFRFLLLHLPIAFPKIGNFMVMREKVFHYAAASPSTSLSSPRFRIINYFGFNNFSICLYVG